MTNHFMIWTLWFMIHYYSGKTYLYTCMFASLEPKKPFPEMQIHTAGNKAPSCTPMPVRQPSTPWQWNNVPEPAAWCACWWRWYGLEEASLQDSSDVPKSRPFDTYVDLCSSTTESVITSKSVLLYMRFLGHVGETRGRCNRFTNKTCSRKIYRLRWIDPELRSIHGVWIATTLLNMWNALKCSISLSGFAFFRGVLRPETGHQLTSSSTI